MTRRTQTRSKTRGKSPSSPSSARRPASPPSSSAPAKLVSPLTAKRRKELLEAIKPKYFTPAPPESPSVVLARLRENEPKPALSRRGGGANLDSTYPERRAAWEKAVAREKEREAALRNGVSPEENQKMASRSEHLVRHLTQKTSRTSKTSKSRAASSKPGRGRRT